MFNKFYLIMLCTMMLFLLSVQDTIFAQFFDWSTPVNVSNISRRNCSMPAIATDNDNNIYVSYVHKEFSENFNLYFTWYDGNSWYERDTLNFDHYNDVYSPRLVIDSNQNVHLIYRVWRNEFERLFYRKRSGVMWENPVQLTADSLGYVYDHAIAIDQSDTVYVLYNQDFPVNFYLRTYKDSVWSDPINFPNITYPGDQSMVCDDHDYLHIAYVDWNGNTNEIMYVKYKNNIGPTVPVNISQMDSLNSLEPNITLDSENRPQVVWRQYIGKTWPNYNHYEIFYSTLTDTGWLSPVNISNLSQVSYKPLILDYKENVIVFFETEYDTLPDKDIYYTVLNNDQWNLYRWEVDSSSIVHHFDGIIGSNDDTIYMVYKKMLNTWDSDIFYVKGYSNPNSIIENKNNTPKSIKLNIYPNPFNNRVTIQFYLDKTQSISLQIYDITGKEVFSDINNRTYRTGYHKVAWNGINKKGKEVSSGLYFAVLKGETKLLTKKLILLR